MHRFDVVPVCIRIVSYLFLDGIEDAHFEKAGDDPG